MFFFVLYSFIVSINASIEQSLFVSGDRYNKELERQDNGLLTTCTEMADNETDKKPTPPADPVLPATVTRGHKKAQLTRAVGGICRLMAENSSAEVLTAHLAAVKTAFHNFEAAHDNVCMELTDEQEIEKNEQYFSKAE